ncbi:uncharacterized protein KY384_003399 [Bacidia gigantensis]|uniref:uncharacterized protein n=1 Tax=Bacidia gigantensis TaxID=2732470 RepID=UPI001D0562E4|nr:uncharacterized protein KY384_003399 [Bacidia gigantensis]KAG8531763.1 hypothetical protein KY384_003399 [Bacidia gigantensis]
MCPSCSGCNGNLPNGNNGNTQPLANGSSNPPTHGMTNGNEPTREAPRRNSRRQPFDPVQDYLSNVSNFKIIESTLREGEQFANAFFDTETKIRIAKALDAFGVEYIELTSPASSKQSYEDCKTICNLGLKAKILTHVRCNMDDARCAVETGVDGLDVVIGTSPQLMEHSHGKSMEYIKNTALEVISYIQSQNLEVRFSSEDSFRSDLVDLRKLTPIDQDIETHMHNDTGCAIANSLCALEAGATHVDTSVLGIGERNGITPLGGFVARMLTLDREYVKGKYNLEKLKPLEDLVAHAVEIHIPFNNYAGIHAKAILANPTTYEVINPADFGMTRYVHFTSRLTGWNAIKSRVEQLGLEMTDAQIKQCTSKIKEMADLRSLAIEDTDAIITAFYENLNAEEGKEKPLLDDLTSAEQEELAQKEAETHAEPEAKKLDELVHAQTNIIAEKSMNGINGHDLVDGLNGFGDELTPAYNVAAQLNELNPTRDSWSLDNGKAALVISRKEYQIGNILGIPCVLYKLYPSSMDTTGEISSPFLAITQILPAIHQHLQGRIKSHLSKEVVVRNQWVPDELAKSINAPGAATMTKSALLGQKAASKFDGLVIEGFWRFVHEKDFKMGPSLVPPHPPIIPVMRPPDAKIEAQQWKTYASMGALIALTVLITGTRLVLRLTKKELRWGLDDWAVIVGALFVVSYGATCISAATLGGGGKHMWDVTHEEYDYWTSTHGVAPTVFFVGLGFVKISICLFNRRLTGLTSRKWSIYHYTLLVLLSLYILSVILGMTLMCMPLWTSYRLSDIGARNYTTSCVNATLMTVVFSWIHTSFDILLLPVPLIVMWRLRLTKWQRVRIFFLFSIGSMSFLGAIMRATHTESNRKDATFVFAYTNRWSIVDAIFGVAVASLPTFNALLPASWRRGSSNDPHPHQRNAVLFGANKASSAGSDSPSRSGGGSEGSQRGGDEELGEVNVGGRSEWGRWEDRKWATAGSGEERGRGEGAVERKSSAVTAVLPPSVGEQPNWDKYAPGFGVAR